MPSLPHSDPAHRPTPPRATRRAVAALAIATMWPITACSAGQITQTATEVAAVNGADAESGHLQLENVYLAVDPPHHRDARLSFTVVNGVRGVTDRLLAVDSQAATDVTITAPPQDLEILPGSRLAAGQPIEQLDRREAPDAPITVSMTMEDAVDPGLNVPVTFTFARAGDVTVDVPVDVWTPAETPPFPQRHAPATASDVMLPRVVE